MRRSMVRRIAVPFVVLLSMPAGMMVANAAPDDPGATPPSTSVLDAGRYIVQLADDPASLYEGGVPGLAATAPTGGGQLDDADTDVVAYADYLEDEQDDVASDVGVVADANLTLTLNAFVADLDGAQAAALASDDRVVAVFPDAVRQPTASPANEYLGLDGLWQQAGGSPDAGEGVVVGIIDSGIAPENPLFAGEALGSSPGAEPYLDGETIRFLKADGGEFSGSCETGAQFTAAMCSTKIVSARYFVDGFTQARIGSPEIGEYLSPRDGSGHGSHTASTAAGNADVQTVGAQGQDFGTMSGVAPAARLAIYKVCWEGADPGAVTDDGCNDSDSVQAIEQAVADGVDVLNFSVGSASGARSVLDSTDLAYLGASAAGVFVSVSAGNSGPGETTIDHISPWLTTVANATIPNDYVASVRLASGQSIVGASTTVGFGQEDVTGEVVYAGDVPAPGASQVDAARCVAGAIDAAQVSGRIVVCDRGVTDRVAKSETVEAAGGIGMILANVEAGSTDADDHTVPTVHVDADGRAAVLAAAQATPRQTVTLAGGNAAGTTPPPAPQVSASSSRGPAISEGERSDVLKPDIAAPGTSILAATANAEGADPTFALYSGTSMAAPHVAGLAAVYLGEHPMASPAEIKSALMTTAVDAVRADGSVDPDVFARGAGFVDPSRFLDPGVYYGSGPQDWYGYLRGSGFELPDAWAGAPIDPSDLNLASIAIGDLAGTQTVTRTLTSTGPGTYNVSVDAPAGVVVDVQPARLQFTAPGQSLQYTATFSTSATATLDAWATGSLTWSSPRHEARSPIAVHPVAADAPSWIEGTGTSGTSTIEVTPGITGALPVQATGLHELRELVSASVSPGFVGRTRLTASEGTDAWVFTGRSDEGLDVDIRVSRTVAGEVVESHFTESGDADQHLVVEDPTPGTWTVDIVVSDFGDLGETTVRGAVAEIGGDALGRLSVSPAAVPGVVDVPATVTATWRDAPVDGSFIGAIDYGAGDARTYLRVTTGSATIPAPERIAGADRFETAIEASQLAYPDQAGVVYLASGENYPDGLAAGPAAAIEGGPLLLTTRGALLPNVAAEIERLEPERIVIVGGTPSLSTAIEDAADELADVVDRVAGADRFETSRLLVDYAFGDTGTAFIATGLDFPDALTAGAAAGSLDAPVILVDGRQDTLDSATAQLLADHDVARTFVAGAAPSVSEGILEALIDRGFSPERLAGADRYLTGISINRAVFDGPVDSMYLASGTGFPDALAASAIAGATGSPLYVVQPTCIPADIIGESLRLAQPEVYLMGGTPTLSEDVATYRTC